ATALFSVQLASSKQLLVSAFSVESDKSDYQSQQKRVARVRANCRGACDYPTRRPSCRSCKLTNAAVAASGAIGAEAVRYQCSHVRHVLFVAPRSHRSPTGPCGGRTFDYGGPLIAWPVRLIAHARENCWRPGRGPRKARRLLGGGRPCAIGADCVRTSS